MKKAFAALLVVVMAFMAFSTTAFMEKAEAGATRASVAVSYYDESGNLVTVDGVYYNAKGYPCFNAGCYYLDEDGEQVFVGGCRAYYYDGDGDLVAGRYCYDANGDAVNPPRSYRGGCGYGTWRCASDGTIDNGSYYYDDFGNLVDPPAQPMPRNGLNGRGGGCCGGGRGGYRG